MFGLTYYLFPYLLIYAAKVLNKKLQHKKVFGIVRFLNII